VSPRAYRLGKRQLGAEETRARIVAAARALLTDPDVVPFTIDAVAVRADVARMTVYYQFKSKGGLLEAVFDDLGARANMKQLRTAFQNPDAAKGLDTLVEIFCRMWQTERALLRRLNALAALDPEVDRAMTARGSWRREGLAEIVRRLNVDGEANDVVDLLHVLTGFETYDALAIPERTKPQVLSLIQRAARGLLGTWTA
jgi:AcrR family transcriptional regulator